MGDTDVAHQDRDRSAGVRHLLAICIISEIFRLAFKEKKLFKDGWQVGWRQRINFARMKIDPQEENSSTKSAIARDQNCKKRFSMLR